MKGIVKKWKDDRGFGFIRPSDGSKDVFVHQSAILMGGHRALIEGERVEFDVDVDEQFRERAVNVRRVDAQLEYSEDDA